LANLDVKLHYMLAEHIHGNCHSYVSAPLSSGKQIYI